jgi:uncharacterized protein (TIGR01777 family)
MSTFRKRSLIACPAQELFDWHARPGAFDRLSPPWMSAQVIERSGGIEDGARLVMQVGPGPFGMRWVAEHRNYIAGQQFADVQVSGPFARWEHVHRFEPVDDGHCYLDDSIDYRLPLGALGGIFGGPFVTAMLERMFAYRHRVTAGDIARHRAYAGAPLTVLVTGASGMIGTQLCAFLSTGGHTVLRAVRGRPKSADEVSWDVERGLEPNPRLEGLDAVVHLAGENVAGGRWSDARKQRIMDSRRVGTRRLCESLVRLKTPPRAFIGASGINYYGDNGAETVDERSPRGAGFLGDVCVGWEEGTEPAREAGIRTVNLRIGVVFSAADGALKQMLPPFRAGVGGVIGDGRQYMSWIGLDDLLAAMLHVIRREDISGPVNAVSPSAVTNAEMTRTLGHVLGRPTILPVPAAALRLALGEMADEMLLSSVRAAPTRLLESGFEFGWGELEPALRHTLGK